MQVKLDAFVWLVNNRKINKICFRGARCGGLPMTSPVSAYHNIKKALLSAFFCIQYINSG